MQRTAYDMKRGRTARRFARVAGLLLCLFSLSAQAEERRYKIEAAYLYSFFNYVTWPGYDSPQQMQKPVICIYGEGDPIVPYLEYVRDKMAGERALSVRQISGVSAVPGCHILFMRHRLIQSPLPEDTLTVFKPDDPLDRGGMVEMGEDGDRIVIKLDQNRLEQNGFSISSRLLDLAQRMR